MSGEDLPPGWVEVPLAQLADSCLGKMLDKNKNTGSPHPYLRNQNVRWEGFDLSDVQEMRFEESEAERFGLRVGDVLVCEGGEPGRAAVWRTEVPRMRFQKAIHRVRCGEAVLPDWVVLSLYREAKFGRLLELFTGTGIAHLTGVSLAKVPITVPPLPEQRRIVAKLDELRARSRKAREALDSVPALLDKLKQSVLAAAFRGDLTAEWRAAQPAGSVEPASVLLDRIRTERRKRWEQANPKKKYVEPEPVDTEGLPELPEGWSWINVGTVTHSVKDGPHYSPAFAESGIPFLSGGNIRPEGVNWTNTKFISRELADELAKRCRPEFNDILYTKGGTTGIARVNTYEQEFQVWVHVAVLKLIPSVLPFYMQHALNSPWCYAQSQRLTHGVGNQDLGLTRMVNITLPLAPLAEQQELVRKVDAVLEGIPRLNGGVHAATSLVDSLDQSILAKAFRGELVPQDPNDEPAEALLARLRDQATTSGAPARPARGRKASRGAS